MLVIRVGDNENKAKSKDGMKQKGDSSYSESVRAKWFFVRLN